jgi:hypothetical protein
MNEIQNPPELQEYPEVNELSHSDKAVGVLTEPSATYTETAKHPPKTIDWFLPFALLLLVVAISNILMMSNENIGYEIKQKQLSAMEKRFDEAVEKGQMTREQADEQMERIQDGMNMGGPITLIITVVSIFIGGFLIFFIVSGIYFLFAKFLLKGDGSFNSALVANGLTAYIGIIQVLVSTILAFVFGRLMKDVSVASLMNVETTTTTGFLLSKLDVFSLWIYIVVGIGLAKMFKSEQTGKYIALSIGLWILGSLLIFVIGKTVPFLSFLGS